MPLKLESSCPLKAKSLVFSHSARKTHYVSCQHHKKAWSPGKRQFHALLNWIGLQSSLWFSPNASQLEKIFSNAAFSCLFVLKYGTIQDQNFETPYEKISYNFMLYLIGFGFSQVSCFRQTFHNWNKSFQMLHLGVCLFQTCPLKAKK